MQAEPPSFEPSANDDVDVVRFRINRAFLVLFIVSLPLLVSLGFWQLSRASEKEQALRVFEEQRVAAPARIASVVASEASKLDGRRVLLRGHYLPEKSFLLDNRILAGRVGYELLMPFAEASGVTVMVNRGWLQAPPTRDQLPPVETPTGELELRGEIHVPLSDAAVDIMATPGWPSVVQSVDVATMSARAGLVTFAYLVRLEPGQPGVTDADWPRVNMAPERHRAYALQWFLMAIALAVIFVSGGTNLLAWLRARRHKARPQ